MARNIRFHVTFAIVLIALAKSAVTTAQEKQNPNSNLPVATQWTLDAAGPTQRTAIRSVFMLVCPTTSSKGTGFLIREGVVITAEHVVHGCTAAEMIGIDPNGARIQFGKVTADPDRDLAALRPTTAIQGGLDLGQSTPQVGSAVSTWGFPLGYNGPAPLLSVGYLSGFVANSTSSRPIKHFVVNGAFNPGNSGGPLFLAGDDKVIGVVVSKHAPMTPFVASAIEAMAKNQSGVVYNATDEKGTPKTFVESQVVAEILEFYRSLTQVMIGEAVALDELRDFVSQYKGKF